MTRQTFKCWTLGQCEYVRKQGFRSQNRQFPRTRNGVKGWGWEFLSNQLYLLR